MEPCYGHLLPKVDKFSCKLTSEIPPRRALGGCLGVEKRAGADEQCHRPCRQRSLIITSALASTNSISTNLNELKIPNIVLNTCLGFIIAPARSTLTNSQQQARGGDDHPCEGRCVQGLTEATPIQGDVTPIHATPDSGRGEGGDLQSGRGGAMSFSLTHLDVTPKMSFAVGGGPRNHPCEGRCLQVMRCRETGMSLPLRICASYCAPCQPLLRAFPGWIRRPSPTVEVQCQRAWDGVPPYERGSPVQPQREVSLT